MIRPIATRLFGQRLPVLRGVLLMLIAAGVGHAANGPPDLLGLRRLDAALEQQAQAMSDAELPSAEQPFIMAPPADASAVSAAEADLSPRRDELLSWLSDYMQQQVLFHNSDLVQLRDALTVLPNDELEPWARNTEQIRRRLTSESWKVTQQWLRQFLAAQAVYTPEQINEWRRRMATLTPSELMLVLDHFETVHLARVRSGRASEQLRMQQLAVAAPMRPATPVAGRAASFGPNSGFPSNVGTQVLRDRNREYVLARRPTISDRVANFYVNRAVFGRWWGWAWWW